MTTQCRCGKVGSTVWEDMAGRSLFSLLFGEWFGYATRGWSEIKRKSFGTGMLFVAVIWLLCLLGDYLLPPLVVLRTYFDEAHWILGKIVLWLLALPVGFPIGYHLTRRRLLRRAEREAQEPRDPETGLPVSKVLGKSRRRARKVQRWYELAMGILLWGWYFFLTPAREWVERPEMHGQSAGLLVVWVLLIALLVVIGGQLVYRVAERRLRQWL